MAGKVTDIGAITRIDKPSAQVLDGAKGIVTGGVVVLGFDSNGDVYSASSIADGGEIMWLLEVLKKRLLE